MSAQEKAPDTQAEQQPFSADVSRLLDIVAHALYTNHDVFLRELISNAADACDRLRYDAISTPALIEDNPKFRICAYKDTTNRTVTLVDNGIGMNETELADNLGTIAKSGTAALMEQLKQAQGEDKSLNLIGQFGVGFYAGYMVASKIEVVSRKAGEDDILLWESDGKSGFSIRPANDIEVARLDGQRGTAITLYIKDEACEFLLDEKIKQTVLEYSDHISIPVYLGAPAEISKDKDAEAINSTSALWMRSNTDVTQEEYTNFYHNLSGGFDEPIMQSHWRAEGKIEFTGLLYIPTLRPWDLFDPSRKNFVKLYVRRVFITDELENLMYPWLRFMRGIIDSEDLPLNISRETLQYNPTIEKIRSAVARRVLGDLDKLSRNDPPAFSAIWGQFGAVIKEGLYDATDHRDSLLKICRFHSSYNDGEEFVSLPEYIDRMVDGQDKIYYVSGENVQNVKNSPQLEGFKSRGIEVLFFTDTIDDFWLQSVLDYKDKTFQSITKGDIDFSTFDGHDKKTSDGENAEQSKEDASTAPNMHKLIEHMQSLLEKDIHNVRISSRLTDSPVCLVAPDSGVDMYMERVLKVHQKYQGEGKPVLEINPDHSLIQKIANLHESGKNIEDAAYLLLDQAKIIQGEAIDDLGAFARRQSSFIESGL